MYVLRFDMLKSGTFFVLRYTANAISTKDTCKMITKNVTFKV